MKIDEIDVKIYYLCEVKRILEKQGESNVEVIFLKYLELERVDRVAIWLNENGKRILGAKGGRKYISTDITNLLDDPDAEKLVNKEIYDLVKYMQKTRIHASWEEKISRYFKKSKR